jgi:hypothetical protein
MRAEADTCVAYLVRREEGVEPVRRFLESYMAHDAGLTHDLVILRRGFRDDHDWLPFATALTDLGVHYDTRNVATTGFDLGAYRELIGSSNQESLCFLNTFSEVLCNSWLTYLHQAAHEPGTGMVGASGSYESTAGTARPQLTMSPLRSLRGWAGWLRRRRDFAPFPNPHIRTNGFLLRRSVALQLRWAPLRTRYDALRRESGQSGLSRQAMALGLRNKVVGCDGLAYLVDDWPTSGTFRCGAQSNLMIADNRTREYEASPPEKRETLGRLAWGDQYERT